jgi:transcriptional regulator GlxA family with amidase domain
MHHSGTVSVPSEADPTSPIRVGIHVFDDVEVLDCCGPFEVFSVANRVHVRAGLAPPFTVSMVATTAEVVARGGLVLRTHQAIQDDPAVDVLLVSGGVVDAAEEDELALDWIARAPAPLKASVCTGAFLLARAGVLTDQQVTTHWDDQDELQERWPRLQVLRDRRWVRDGDVFTSGGISAGIDLSLHLVEVLTSREMAEATAHLMEYRWVQDGA